MGEVYEAYDNEIGRTIALKIIKSQFANDRQYRMRFERESHAAAKLQEPHVIPIHGFGEIDGCLFIDMRLVRGDGLAELDRQGAPRSNASRGHKSSRSPQPWTQRTARA